MAEGTRRPDPREFLIVAGEPSADAHAARLVREIRCHRPDWRFFGIGGPALATAGAEIVVPMSQVTVMGFGEVIPKLRAVARAFKALEEAVRNRLPSAAILLDFPDFNLRLARRLKKYRLPVVYYIGPQVWAWRAGRVETIRRLVDKLIVILPFETEFYSKHGIAAEYVGHPLLDAIDSNIVKGGKITPTHPSPLEGEGEGGGGNLPGGTGPAGAVLALLPGSRIQETRRCLPVMLEAVEQVRRQGVAVRPVVCLADAVADRVERSSLPPEVVYATQGTLQQVLLKAEAAIVVSGTATLECAIHHVPMVVVYKTSALNYCLARALVDAPYIALVNWVAGRKCVPELIQGEASPKGIARELAALLTNSERRNMMRIDLEEVHRRLGTAGAGARAAQAVIGFVEKSVHG